MKYCPRCRETKSTDDFNRQFKRGKWQPRTYCKPCSVSYEVERVAKRKAGAVVVPRYVAPCPEVERELCAALWQWRGPVTAGLGARL